MPDISQAYQACLSAHKGLLLYIYQLYTMALNAHTPHLLQYEEVGNTFFPRVGSCLEKFKNLMLRTCLCMICTETEVPTQGAPILLYHKLCFGFKTC